MIKKYEVRVGFYGGLMCTSNNIKMLRFDLEMKDHYRQEHEKHELEMQLLKLKTRSILSWIPFM